MRTARRWSVRGYMPIPSTGRARLAAARYVLSAALRTCSRSFLISADYADAPEDLSE
ncbi:hypothetical protein XCCB100_0153 [Xanthomonas campestris pv. campestris]|uniref:Uncharacterized protein n=1 Tax=Xanthomonas campestris pv. campestris (strain B100) TaxID=509169 RepID=B0RLB5_XANCB|nr:hypothetical protein XCCB100_0153 [Xanthomonas campestris pv. campestris]